MLAKFGKIFFPLGIVRRELCQARHDRLALPQKVESLCLVAGLFMHQRELAKAHREIALPAGIAGIGFREALGNGEAILIGFQRAGKIACAACTPPTLL